MKGGKLVSYMTLIGVQPSLQLMHPNQGDVTIISVCV